MKNCLFARLVISMLCLVVLMSACGRDVQPTLPQETGETTEPSEKTSIPETVDYEVVELKERDFHIVYPKDCDFDYYFDLAGSFGYPFYILSRTPLDPDTISVDAIGTEMEDFVVCDDSGFMTLEQAPNDYRFEYQDYLSFTRNGIDWKTAGELYLTASEIDAELAKDPMNAELREKSAEAWRNYGDFMTPYQEVYAQDRESFINGHSYYAYQVVVGFETPATAETVESIHLEVAGERYTLEIGQIRLYPGLYEHLGLEMKELQGITDSSMGAQLVRGPWENGSFQYDLRLTAEADLTLDRLELVTEEGAAITDIQVERVSASGVATNMQWNGDSRYDVDEGDRITLLVSLYDPRIVGKAEYLSTVHLVYEYTVDGETISVPIGLELKREQNLYDLCAMYLDGVDLRSYYVDFYRFWPY